MNFIDSIMYRLKCPYPDKLEYVKEHHREHHGSKIISVYQYKCPICRYTTLTYYDNPETVYQYEKRNEFVEQLLKDENKRNVFKKDEANKSYVSDDKFIFVINGKGGVGKDFLVDGFRDIFGEDKVDNISSVDIVKKLASMVGWDGSKDKESRAFLSDLKRVLIKYNDIPLKDMMRGTKEFVESSANFLFVHIREPKEIDKYMDWVNYNLDCRDLKSVNKAISILVKREDKENLTYGNSADDNVNDYTYDLVYNNDKEKDEAKGDFVKTVMQYINYNKEEA